MPADFQKRLTPEQLIERPRRSIPTPNDAGTHALFNISAYSIEAKAETKETYVLDLTTGQTVLFTDDTRFESAQWLTDQMVLETKTLDDGKTELWISNAVGHKKRYLAGQVPAPISRVKTKVLSNGSIALAFSAPCDEDEKLLNTKDVTKSSSTAREFESVRVRYWDKYWEKYRSSLWYTVLEKSDATGGYSLIAESPTNALAGSGIEFPWCDGPHGEDGSYEIAETGLLVTTVNPTYNLAWRWSTDVYYLPLNTFKESPVPKISQLFVPGWIGLSSEAVFSPDGKSIAFLKQKIWEREDGNNAIFICKTHDCNALRQVQLLDHGDPTKTLDFSPTSLLFASDAKSLFVTGQDHGRVRLFAISTSKDRKPRVLTENGSVKSVSRLSRDRLLITRTSMVHDDVYETISQDPANRTCELLHADYSTGLKSSQVSEVLFKGADDYDVQCFVMKPSTFREDEKYPVALLIHGGPQAAWLDWWNTRWNAAVFAEQGYIVLMPNLTGSTGFGEQFRKAVKGDWGGRAYEDILRCWDYVEQNLPYADCSRAVCLGASYGGYMANWIAGQPFGKNFRTLVCHGGIFNTANLLAGDIQDTNSLGSDMGGTFWTSREQWDKFDPSRHTQNWTQPMLFIHSDNDYRCPVAEGLAAFAICQQKGIPSRFLNFPDENHWVTKPANSLHWYRTVLGWCNKYVGITDGVKLATPVSETHRKESRF